MDEKSKMAIISLGSNLSDSRLIIAEAMTRLQALSTSPLLKSSLWQTTPVDCPPGSPLFINAAVALTPLAEETPETFLDKLQALEKEFGRRPKRVTNEPRLLDLDLIAFGQETRDTEKLTLPHPRAQERKFVLQPAAEVTPDFVLPGQTKSIKELLGELKSNEQLVRLAVE
jgi:2-amino-4-hydroxy-6-hydroxymethyldihydropteridine diphosphokinase